MVSYRWQARGGETRVQGGPAGRWGARAALLAGLATFLALAACSTGSGAGPVEWWHDLQGGTIAATRPPPPGADLPYPHLGTIPAKPVVPSASFRQTLQTNLTEQRDDTERLAARTPIELPSATVPPPPPKQPATPAADTANATLPGADSPAQAAAPATQATLGQPPGQPSGSPAPNAPVTIAGAPADESDLPVIPDAPPLPATFEGVPAQPAPTPPPPLPAHLSPALAGSVVLFRPGDATLDHSQIPTLRDAINHRGHGDIEVEGHGDTTADSPTAQAAALTLGLKRAQSIAKELAALHVPHDKIRLSATAFGRDASLRLIP
jgi:outer membrane protein OmpA-like peptidoglycan-associated protein